MKKKRSAKQRANDKRLGLLAKRRSTKVKRRSSSSKPMARRRRARTRTRTRTVRTYSRRGARGIKSVFSRSGIVGKAAAGIGAGVIAGTVLNQFAPQFSPIAKPIAGFLAGGPVGAVAQVFMDGGIGTLTGMFGSQKQEVGGL